MNREGSFRERPATLEMTGESVPPTGFRCNIYAAGRLSGFAPGGPSGE